MAKVTHPQIEYLRSLLGTRAFSPDQAFTGRINGRDLPVYPTGGYWPQFKMPEEGKESQGPVGLTRIHHQVGASIVKSATIIMLPQKMTLNILPSVQSALSKTPLQLEDMRFSIPMTVSPNSNCLVASAAEADLAKLVIRPFLDVDIVTGLGVNSQGLFFSATKDAVSFADLIVSGYKMARLSLDEHEIGGISMVKEKTVQKWVETILNMLKNNLPVMSGKDFGSRLIAKSYTPKIVYLFNEIGIKMATQRGESFNRVSFDPSAVPPIIPQIPNI